MSLLLGVLLAAVTLALGILLCVGVREPHRVDLRPLQTFTETTR